MAVETPITARWNAALDNVTGKAHTPAESSNIATNICTKHVETRARIVAAGLNPDALTNAQKATYALFGLHSAARTWYLPMVKSARRDAAIASVQADVESDINEFSGEP